MRSSPFAAVLLAASLLAFSPATVRAVGEPPPECPTGTCSGRVPAYTDTAWTNHFLGKRIAAGTMQGQAPTDYVVSLFDLSTNVPALNTNWANMQRYHGRMGGSGFAGWNVDSLGTVFGITLDNAGNIYVCSSSSYNGDAISNAPGATAGSIFKIDRTTAYVSVFANLPNSFDPAYAGNPADAMPALGNITYDPVHQLLFVSDFEDGKIYRLNMSGTILGSYDPMSPDNGLPGFAPLGERVWAVQWHTDNKIYFSLWNTDSRATGPLNEIHSISLDGSGNFVPASELPVITVPALPSFSWSHPVSDISFAPGGQMLLAERCMFNETNVTAHMGRLLEYSCDLGTWYLMPGPHDIGNYVGPPFNGSAGGTDADYAPYVAGGVNGRHWVTGDAIHYLSEYLYGAQGFPPAGGTTVNSMMFDYDGNVANVDKFEIGDIEITCPVDTGSVHGGKYNDEDCDGKHDPGETGIPGWPVVITGPSGSVTLYTDASGAFHAWGLPNGTYTICELGAAGWNQTQPAGGCYTVVVNGSAMTGYLFGNCRSCAQPQPPCKPLPWTGVLWLPLDEPTGAIAHDVAGGNPGQISGDLALIHNPVAMDKGLRFSLAGDHIRSADSPSLDFGADGDFSLVASFELDQVGGQHFLFDKRQPTASGPRGYALSVENGSVVVRMQNGTAPPIYTSASVMTPGSHHTVALTVERHPSSTGGGATVGKVYLDGALLGSFDPAPAGTPIDVSNDAPLSIGTNSTGTSAFGGWIDEPMVFARALSFTEAIGPWNPVICKQWCSVPPSVNFGPYATSATATFTICNYDFSAPSMNYSWSLNGLPAGTCSVNGPTVYSPSSGSMTIPAGSCQSVTVTITRPVWLTPGSSGCFVFNVSNNTNHTCFSCTSKATASKKWWVLDPIDWIGVGHGTTKMAHFTVSNADPVGTSRILVLSVKPGRSGDPSAAQYVSLNGLPPGEPILIQRSVAGGGSTDVDVEVSYPVWAHLPDQWLTVDVTDEEGDLEPTTIACTNVRLDDGAVLAVEPPATGVLVDAVGAWPNPARGTTRIRLSLAKAARVQAAVYDVAGRNVRMLQRGTMPAGAHDLQWDGRDDGGRPVQAGLYFVRMTADDREYGARLVLVR